MLLHVEGNHRSGDDGHDRSDDAGGVQEGMGNDFKVGVKGTANPGSGVNDTG